MQHAVIYNSRCTFPRDSVLLDFCYVSITALCYVKAPAESWDESAAKYHIQKLLSHNESTGFEVIKSLIV